MESDRREAREHFAQQNSTMTRVLEELRDLREESRAQREALFRMLDRLDGNGGTAAAG